MSKEKNKTRIIQHDLKFWKNLSVLLHSMNQSSTESEVVEIIGSFCKKTFLYDKATLFTRDYYNNRSLVIKWTDGYRGDFTAGEIFRAGKCLFGDVLKSNKPVIFNYAAQNKKRINIDVKNDPGFLGFFGIPIRWKNSVFGALVFETNYSPSEDGENIENLGFVQKNIGAAFHRMKEYHILHDRSVKDGLTKLYNRRAFDEAVTRELARSARYKSTMCLLMIDIDCFKNVNDNYGHLFGDFVLQRTAELLQKNVRKIDHLARYGGEEFTVIVVNATKKLSFSTAERLRSAIEQEDFEKDDISINLKISIGIAEYPTDGKDVEKIISRADIALYDAKKAGGNLVKHFKKERSTDS